MNAPQRYVDFLNPQAAPAEWDATEATIEIEFDFMVGTLAFATVSARVTVSRMHDDQDWFETRQIEIEGFRNGVKDYEVVREDSIRWNHSQRGHLAEAVHAEMDKPYAVELALEALREAEAGE